MFFSISDVLLPVHPHERVKSVEMVETVISPYIRLAIIKAGAVRQNSLFGGCGPVVFQPLAYLPHISLWTSCELGSVLPPSPQLEHSSCDPEQASSAKTVMLKAFDHRLTE